MMRREWLVVWCGAAILIAATVLVCLADESQGRMMRDQMHDGHDQGNQEEQTANNFKHLLKHAKEIGLTPEQIGRLKAMQLDFSRTQSRMEADIKIATLELDALLEEEQTELSTIQAKINELKQAAQGDDIDHIKKLTEELQNTFHALSQQMYAQGQQGQQPQPEGGPSNQQDGDVIDGEVKE